MSEELKACPFCKCTEIVAGKDYTRGNYRVDCLGCSAFITAPSLELAIQYWNTRPIEDELRAENSALRERVRWRKYPDEMPKHGFYLALENVNQVAGYYHWCKQFGWNTDRGRINIQSVTHWMPLPTPPEESENE